MSVLRRHALGLAVAVAVFAGGIEGQSRGLREVDHFSAGHIGLAVAEPVGQFAQAVGIHPGLDLSYTWGGPVGVRLGGSLLVYGTDRRFVPAGGWYFVELETNNLIGTLGIGPQITMGRGPVRLYGWGTVGISYFATVTSLGAGCGCDGFSATNYDDVAFAREAGAGLQIALSRRRPWYLDLSARYLHNGRVSYLREGDLVEYHDGTYSVRPRESEANLLVYQLGVSFGRR